MVIWNMQCPEMNAAKRVKDCLPQCRETLQPDFTIGNLYSYLLNSQPKHSGIHAHTHVHQQYLSYIYIIEINNYICSSKSLSNHTAFLWEIISACLATGENFTPKKVTKDPATTTNSHQHCLMKFRMHTKQSTKVQVSDSLKIHMQFQTPNATNATNSFFQIFQPMWPSSISTSRIQRRKNHLHELEYIKTHQISMTNRKYFFGLYTTRPSRFLPVTSKYRSTLVRTVLSHATMLFLFPLILVMCFCKRSP